MKIQELEKLEKHIKTTLEYGHYDYDINIFIPIIEELIKFKYLLMQISLELHQCNIFEDCKICALCRLANIQEENKC